METLPLDHQNLRSIIESAGLRCTPQRLAVYEYLSHSKEHPTAEHVYQGVRSRLPKISLATVYKTLEALVAIGAATKLTAGTGRNRSRYDARRDLHYHFRCQRSGTVHDLPTHFDPDLIAKLDPRLHEDLNRQGFEVTGYRLELVGYQTNVVPDAMPAISVAAEIRQPSGHDLDPAASVTNGIRPRKLRRIQSTRRAAKP